MIIDENYVLNYMNEKVWSLKDSLICESISKNNSKEIELTLVSTILDEDMGFYLKIFFNKKEKCVRTCILNYKENDEKKSFDIAHHLHYLNAWVFNNNEYLIKEMIKKRNIDLSNINNLKNYILENIPIEKDKIEIRYNVQVDGNDIEAIGYKIVIDSKNNINILVTNDLKSNINYTLDCEIMTKKTISGNVRYNIRENNYKFFNRKDDKYDSFKELFNEIDDELSYLYRDNIIIENNHVLVENVLNTTSENFNVLSQNFLKDIKFNLDEIKENQFLLTHTIKKIKEHVTILKESLNKMEIILNNESNESMKHIFENNYKKCNLIYDNYLFKLELLGNNLVKNINNEMTISLDEQLKKIG